MIDSSLVSVVKGLRLVVFDFDGVFTTNEVIVSQDGTESVICNRSDGLGLRLLRAEKIATLILSMEQNPVVRARATKLKLECIHGCEDKLTTLVNLARERGIALEEIAYVGNDVNDVQCMRAVGLAVAPKDSYPEALKAARWVLTRNGGNGAVREFCEEVAKIRMGLRAEESPWDVLGETVYERSRPVVAATNL